MSNAELLDLLLKKKYLEYVDSFREDMNEISDSIDDETNDFSLNILSFEKWKNKNGWSDK